MRSRKVRLVGALTIEALPRAVDRAYLTLALQIKSGAMRKDLSVRKEFH